jgi:hypothetical protein
VGESLRGHVDAEVTRLVVMKMDAKNPFQQLEELFRAGKPKESHKRQRRPSKRALVGRLLPDIERLLGEGYSFVGIAGYFVDLGLHMPVTTLKNYVARARRDLARSSGKGRPRVTSRGTTLKKRQVGFENARRSTTTDPDPNRGGNTIAPAPRKVSSTSTDTPDRNSSREREKDIAPPVSVITGPTTPVTPPEHARGTPLVPRATALPVGVGFIPRNR